MPFLTLTREKMKAKPEDVYYPEIKWLIEGEDHQKYYKGEPSAVTVVIEQAPMNRMIKYREGFYSGSYTEYFLQMPWTYWLARVSQKGVILLSGMFAANKELQSITDKGLCAMPLPNNDYGKDKGLGVCLWKRQASFGSSQKEAAVKAHEYIWTSVYNPGVSYYAGGRPADIRSSSWPGSLEKWQALTRAEKMITWVPVVSKKLKKRVRTIQAAFQWLSMEHDHLYS